MEIIDLLTGLYRFLYGFVRIVLAQVDLFWNKEKQLYFHLVNRANVESETTTNRKQMKISLAFWGVV